MDNELDLLSDSPREHRPLSDDGFAFSFPRTDDEKSMEIPSLFAMASMELEPLKTTVNPNGSGVASESGTGRNGKRRGAQTEFPILDGTLVTSSGSTVSQRIHLAPCHSKKSSVGLAQSVTEDVAHSVHSVDDQQELEEGPLEHENREVEHHGVEHHGDGHRGVAVSSDHPQKDIKHIKHDPVHDREPDRVHEEDDEKSTSLGYDHYDEEYTEMMPIMEGLEGVRMTNAGNPGNHSDRLNISPEASEPTLKDSKELSIDRNDSDEMKVSGIKYPTLLSPHSVDPGMDDDLFVSCHFSDFHFVHFPNISSFRFLTV